MDTKVEREGRMTWEVGIDVQYTLDSMYKIDN